MTQFIVHHVPQGLPGVRSFEPMDEPQTAFSSQFGCIVRTIGRQQAVTRHPCSADPKPMLIGLLNDLLGLDRKQLKVGEGMPDDGAAPGIFCVYNGGLRQPHFCVLRASLLRRGSQNQEVNCSLAFDRHRVCHGDSVVATDIRAGRTPFAPLPGAAVLRYSLALPPALQGARNP